MEACLFRLAAALGVTTDDLGRCMAPQELAEWCRFLRRQA